MKNKNPRIKKPGINPAKQKAIVKHKVESLMEIRYKDRCRMLWCMIISMAESGVNFTQDDIMKIIDGVKENFDEFNELVNKYGEDLADEKLNIRANEVLGLDPLRNGPETLYDNKSEEDNGET